MVKKNLFVLLGKDPVSKKIRIDKIRDEIVHQGISLNSVSVYCHEACLVSLQKELENLSFVTRFVVFKNAEVLAPEAKRYLRTFLERKSSGDCFVFDFLLIIHL